MPEENRNGTAGSGKFDPRETFNSVEKLTERATSIITDRFDISPIVQELLDLELEKKQACLIVLNGQEMGRIISVEDGQVILGRDRTCDAVLDDDTISRNHAMVVRMGPENVLIKDMGSTNGTFVNGKKIRQMRLTDKDKVLLGERTVLKFMLQDKVEQIHHQDIYESFIRDGLTGAFNRKHMFEKMIADLAFSQRHQLPFTLALFDLDHFRMLNDRYGHTFGDIVLTTVARTVEDSIRVEDSLARYGGEEFAVIAQGTDFAGAKILGERIRSRIEEEKLAAEDEPGELVQVTVSLGIASVRRDAVVDSATVLAVADKNLYEAKRNGRNLVVATEIGR